MPDEERRVIWGMMVGEEGKTKIPILQNYTKRGFDPTKDMLQSYGTGWQSANFLEQERQFFGAPGGILHDWDLKTLMASMLPVISFMHLTAPDLPVQQVTMPGEKLLPVQSPVSFHLTIQRKRPASRPVCTHRSLSKMESTGRN